MVSELKEDASQHSRSVYASDSASDAKEGTPLSFLQTDVFFPDTLAWNPEAQVFASRRRELVCDLDASAMVWASVRYPARLLLVRLVYGVKRVPN